jgi:hypothetical protein
MTMAGGEISERPLEGEEPRSPDLSIWPAVTAAGLALGLFGVVGLPIFSAAGAVIGLVAIAGWVRELTRE